MSNLISQSLLPEFDMEMANTRRLLERVPEARGAFAPHPKSMTLSRLAGHVAEMPQWAAMTLGPSEFDMRPDGAAAFKAYELTSTADALAFFDLHASQARALLAAATDAVMMSPWSLKDNGKTVMTLPRIAVMRSFVMNHMIHHRAQLGVYLRMNDIPIPGLYGPSADEQ
jgi:uncharacterized damage-inducible protein DinB